MISHLTYLPVIVGTKVPALRKGFSYADFRRGETRMPDFIPEPGIQYGVVCAPQVGMYVLDVDDVDTYVSSDVHEVMQGIMPTVVRGDRCHYYVWCDCPRYPVQGPMTFGDCKANGFVVAAGGVHHSGDRYIFTAPPVRCTEALHAAMDTDKALRQLIAADKRGGAYMPSAWGHFRIDEWMRASGYQTYLDIPDESLGSRDELVSLVASMYVCGLTDAEAWMNFASIARDDNTGDPWTEQDFDNMWRAASRRYIVMEKN